MTRWSLAAIAAGAIAAPALAQNSWIRQVPSTTSPAHSEIVSIDVVRDADGASGAFYAWQFGQFRTALTGTESRMPGSAVLGAGMVLAARRWRR